jgi:hypothetical protein
MMIFKLKPASANADQDPEIAQYVKKVAGEFPLPASMRESSNALVAGCEVEEYDTVPAELLVLFK